MKVLFYVHYSDYFILIPIPIVLSGFADFEATQNLSDVEQSLIEETNEQLILDIFNEAVVNW